MIWIWLAISMSALLPVLIVVAVGSVLLWPPHTIWIISALAIATWICLTLCHVAIDRRVHQLMQQRMHWCIAGVLLTCVLSVCLTHWPLRLAFVLSRPALDELASKIETGYVLNNTERAGVFLIRDAGVNSHGVVYLWTNPDPGGPIGLARCSANTVGRAFNLWTSVELADEWQAVFED